MILHIKWQRVVVNDLKSIFPKVQFIATTHSPFIIQSLEEGELISLDKEIDAEYSGESIEDITEEIMGGDTSEDRSLNAIKICAVSSGFFSVWMLVFKDE